jgi:nucleotide-binding universal stress UspA family protein
MTGKGQDGGHVIVVGYDGSPSARAAVDIAAMHAGADGKLYIVHAYEPVSDALGYPYYQRELQAHEERGQAVLDELTENNETLAKTNYVTELLGEEPVDAIANVARARHADEIVVGSHGHSKLRQAALGGTSHDLLHRDDLPPVVVTSPR